MYFLTAAEHFRPNISVDKNTARATPGTDMPVAPPSLPSMKKSAARIRLDEDERIVFCTENFPRLHVGRDVGESDAAAVSTHLEKHGFGEDGVRAEVVQPREQRRVLLGARGGTPVCTRHHSTLGRCTWPSDAGSGDLLGSSIVVFEYRLSGERDAYRIAAPPRCLLRLLCAPRPVHGE